MVASQSFCFGIVLLLRYCFVLFNVSKLMRSVNQTGVCLLAAHQRQMAYVFVQYFFIGWLIYAVKVAARMVHLWRYVAAPTAGLLPCYSC